MTALMVCIRFSAWSKTIECLDSKTSSVTSSASSPVFWKSSSPTSVSPVVEGRQAVHELDVRVAGLVEQRSVDLVGQQQVDALLPRLLGLTHGDPDVGVDEVDAVHARPEVVGVRDPGAGLRGDLLRGLDRPPAWLHRTRGATIRTSMPIIAPATSSELPTLLWASPR